MIDRISAIQDRLLRIRRRILLVRAGFGLLIFFSALILILLLTELSARLGHGSVLVGLAFWAAALIGLAGMVILIRRSWLSREGTALFCERKFPELNDGLISLVQLSRMMKEGKADFSPALFEKHLEQLEEKLSRLRLEQVANPKLLRIPAIGFSGLFAAWLAFVILLPGFPITMFQAVALKGIQAGKGRELLKVSRPLELYDFVIDYRFPAYSGLPPKHLEGADGSVSGLAGSEVEIRASSQIDLSRAWLQILPEGRIAAEVKGRELKAKMMIGQSGQYRFEAEDKKGLVWSEPEFNKINAIPDQVPEVELIAPVQDLVVNEEEGLTVKFRSRDDYGLDSVALVFSSRGGEKRILIKEFRPAELETELEYGWNLIEENLLPGEKVAYYLEAKDNNNVTGPGIGRSQTRYLEVFSPLKAHEQIIAREQELFESLIGFLGRSLEAEQKKMEAGKYWETETALLTDFKAAREFLETLQPEVEKDGYSPYIVKEMMVESIERYRQLIMDRESSRNQRNQARTSLLRKNTVSRLEQDILFWDQQLQKQRMDFLVALGERLKQGQKDLAKLLAQYERTKDPELLKAIEAKLDELKMLYQEFLARLSEMGQTVPDEFVNLDAMGKTGAGEVFNKLEKFRQAVHDRDLDNALSEADDFMSALDQMLSQLKEGSDKMGSSFSSELMTGLMQGLEKIRALKEAEQKLIQDTDPVYRKQVAGQEQESAALEKKKVPLQDQLEELSRLIQRQTQDLNLINPAQKQDANQAQKFYQDRNQLANKLWQMSRELENAKKDLEQNQFDSAGKRLGNLEKDLGQMKNDFKNISQGIAEQSDQSKAFESNCSSGSARAGSAKKGIEALGKEMEAELSGQDQAKLRALGGRQGEIEGQLNELIKELGGVFEKLPVKPPQTLEHLGRSDLKMKDAQGELELRNPDLGLNAEKEADHWLEQAENSLQKFMDKIKENARPGSGVSMNMPMPGGRRPGMSGPSGLGARTEKIKIPGPDENQDPVELRKKILRAMRENSPREYEDLNRDYYKRLVQ